MKKTSSFALLLITMSSMILFSCNGSKKGKWSEADKKKFYSEAKKEIGSSFEDMGLDKQMETDVLDCYFEKCQNQYSSYNDADKNIDDEQAKKITDECTKILMSKYIKKAAKDMESYKNSGSSEMEDAPLPESTEEEEEEQEDY